MPAPTADSLEDGELLCETIAFVIAAGQRAGLQGSASYAGAPVTDVVMGGGSISRVVASKDGSVPVGTMVSSNGWERFTVQKAKGVQIFEEGTDGLDPVVSAAKESPSQLSTGCRVTDTCLAFSLKKMGGGGSL